ncbi:MAG: phage portal protein pbsx family [Sedimentibacter sp.]|jgi:PBSX family phage portal protein|nr:phage portal protein pbsx family [Sedimentibacter sp.]
MAEKIRKNSQLDGNTKATIIKDTSGDAIVELSTEDMLTSVVFKQKETSKKIKKPVNGTSKQIEDEFVDLYGSDIIEPPYNQLLWASLMETNTRLAKLIRTYARNTVGLGWRIVPKKAITKKTTAKEKKAIEEEKEMLEDFFNNISDILPFEEICFRAKVDEESMGNGYLEVTRDLKGKPMHLFHISGHTVRVLRNKKGFVQIRDGQKVYFKLFNGDYDMNYLTGEIVAKGALNYEERATEIIPFQIYTPRDSYYGIPRYVSTADAIAGNKLSARRNLSFFKNDATPRMAITVANGQLTTGSIQEIKDFVNSEGKGVDNAHRAMIIQAKGKNMGDASQNNVKIDVVPLTVGQTDDGSFIKYREANDEEIREAFGIGEVFLGSKGTVNRATASILREITNNQEFIPDAKVKEFMINQTICKDLGARLCKLEFVRPSALGELDMADIFARYLQGGGITPNDIRHQLGKDEYSEEWADKPIQIALVEYQMGLLAEQGAALGGDNGKTDSNNDENNEGNNTDEDENNDSKDGSNKSNKEKNEQVEKIRLKIIDTVQKMLDQSMTTAIISLDDDN